MKKRGISERKMSSHLMNVSIRVRGKRRMLPRKRRIRDNLCSLSESKNVTT